MIAMTGIAYGTSRRTVTNHAVGTAEIISQLLGQEVQAGDDQDDDEQPEGRLMALEEARSGRPSGAGALAEDGGWAVTSASRVLDRAEDQVEIVADRR